MTIIEGLNQMKKAGITKLAGMHNTTDIDTYIEHATQSHENAVKYAAMGIETWQHSHNRLYVYNTARQVLA